jgi:hypothetical protein
MNSDSQTGTATPAGLQFGPTDSGKIYLSMYAHRQERRRKSTWSDLVPPADEYGIFVAADSGNWKDGGHYWGIRDASGSVLGTGGERLSKFPRNQVRTAPWHGYPVSASAARGAGLPSDRLVKRWIEDGTVTRTVGRKIQRRRI